MEPRLRGHGLRLRLFRPSDAELLYEAVSGSIPEISPWLPWCHADYSIEDSRTWLDQQPELVRNKEAFPFAIFSDQDPDETRLLGGCGLAGFDKAHSLCNLGYWVRSQEAGQGIATKATLLCAGYALDELKVARVEIVVQVGNTASLRVAQKVGALEEGVLRNRIRHHGQDLDAVMFSLVPGDMRAEDR